MLAVSLRVCSNIPDELRRNTLRRPKVPGWIKCVRRMYAWTHVPPICDAAGIPCCPACQLRRAGDVGSIGFKVIKSVRGILAHGAAKNSKEH